MIELIGFYFAGDNEDSTFHTRERTTRATEMSLRSKATLFSVVNLIAAAAVYWHLVKGGWLTNHYQLDDPNIVNLVLAIFEPIALISVIAYWLWRKSFLYRLVSILALIQIIVGAGFLIFFLVFMLTWHPKMM